MADQLYQKDRSRFILNDISRVNRFQVTIPLPRKIQDKIDQTLGSNSILPDWLTQAVNIAGILSGNAGHGDRHIQFMCRSTEFPGYQVETVKQVITGHNMTVAVGIDRDHANFAFQLSKDCFERGVFEDWKDLIIDEKNRHVGYYDDYITDIQIDMLDNSDNVMDTVWLLEAWPITCENIQKNKLNADALDAFGVSFAYKRVTNEMDRSKGSTSGIPGSIGGIIDGIMNGDLESAAYAGRVLIGEIESGNYTGEALALVGKINEVMKSTTGFSGTEISKTVKGLGKMVNMSTKVSSVDKSSISNMLKRML